MCCSIRSTQGERTSPDLHVPSDWPCSEALLCVGDGEAMSPLATRLWAERQAGGWPQEKGGKGWHSKPACTRPKAGTASLPAPGQRLAQQACLHQAKGWHGKPACTRPEAGTANLPAPGQRLAQQACLHQGKGWHSKPARTGPKATTKRSAQQASPTEATFWGRQSTRLPA